MRPGRRRLVLLGIPLAVVAVLAGLWGLRPDHASLEDGGVAYLLVAHPDDEWQGLGPIVGRDDLYPVLVLLTRGEEATACDPEAGPGWYQGPDSPVGEPDLGERRPTPAPWVGRWTRACEQARVDSWLGFLSELAELAPGVPAASTLDQRQCWDAGESAPERIDRRRGEAVASPASCATFAASDRGVLVAFDLGDGDLTPDEVRWALARVRDHRAELGIPADEPDAAAVAAAFANGRREPGGEVGDVVEGCEPYPHPDHWAVQEALHELDFPGTRLVPTCSTTSEVDEVFELPDQITDAVFQVADRRRVGLHGRWYGWLHERYWPWCQADCLFPLRQHFTRLEG